MKKTLWILLILRGIAAHAQDNIGVLNAEKVNTIFQEFSPTIYKDGVVFISNNPSVTATKKLDESVGSATTSFFYARREADGSLEKPIVFAGELMSKFYDGPLSFTADGNTVYFTRTYLRRGKPVAAKDGFFKLAIYKAEKKNGRWQKIALLPFNDRQFDCMHPSVSADGKRLYFASNRPNGFGGIDLYVSFFIENQWSEPLNLGSKVNTVKDEAFPFVHPDGLLYFASNGHEGLGGVDIFATKRAKNGWETPQLLPEPINSRSNDFSIAMNADKTWGYFASNRAHGRGAEDVYHFFAPDGLIFSEEAPVENVPLPVVTTVATTRTEAKPVFASQVETIASAPKTETAQISSEPVRALSAVPRLPLKKIRGVDAKTADWSAEMTQIKAKIADFTEFMPIEIHETVPANPSENKQYLVIIGTYAQRENAEEKRNEALQAGLAATEIIAYKDKPLFGVCVERADNAAAAQNLAHTIQKKYRFAVFVKELK